MLTILADTIGLIADAEKYIGKFDKFLEKSINALEDKFILIVFAIIIFLGGLFLSKIALSITKNLLIKSKVDIALHHFVLSSLKITLIVLILITCASIFVPVTSLLTVLGAFGLAISLAVKDSLSNVAAGILLLLTKPFTIKDYVNIDNTSGIVSEIGLVYTVLKTFDNQIIHISNSDVSNAKIINLSSERFRRLDLVFSIGYDDDFEKAKAIIRNCALNNRYIEPEDSQAEEHTSIIRVCEHGDSAIKICCKVWVTYQNYWDLKYHILENVKLEFDKAKISIPYNQLDLHLIKKEELPV